MRKKRGVGGSKTPATAPKKWRATGPAPASPPRNSHAPSRLITRNENATGRPRNSSRVEPPSISHAAASHDMALAGRHRVVARRTWPEREAAHAEEHIERQRKERHRERTEQPPLRRDKRLDRDRSCIEARKGGAGAGVSDGG